MKNKLNALGLRSSAAKLQPHQNLTSREGAKRQIHVYQHEPSVAPANPELALSERNIELQNYLRKLCVFRLAGARRI